MNWLLMIIVGLVIVLSVIVFLIVIESREQDLDDADEHALLCEQKREDTE